MTRPRQFSETEHESVDTDELRTRGVPFHDVTAYGATGDGTTDDTQAIQDAINAAEQNGIVFLPPGTYQIGALGFGDIGGLGFIGANPSATTLQYTGSDTFALDLTLLNWLEIGGFTLIDSGGSGTHGIGNPDGTSGPRRSIFRYLRVQDFSGDGYHVNDCWNTIWHWIRGQNCQNGLVMHSSGGGHDFQGLQMASNTNVGADIRGGGAINIFGGVSESNGVTGLKLGDLPSTGGAAQTTNVYNIHCEINGTYAIDIDQGRGVSVYGCRGGSGGGADTGIKVNNSTHFNYYGPGRWNCDNEVILLGDSANGQTATATAIYGPIRNEGAGTNVTNDSVTGAYLYDHSGPTDLDP